MNLSELVDSLTPTATSTPNEQTGDTIMTKSNTNKQKREPRSGETSPSFPPPKSYQFFTPDQTQETNNPTKETKKGTVAEESEKSTIGTKITNSNSAGQTAKVNGQNLTKFETLRNVTKTVENLKLEAKMQAEELDATHEERFRNKRVRRKVNVTKDPGQYEKENSGVAIRSKEKAGNENKPIDISDSTLVQELSKQTLSQDHLPSLADIEIYKEKRLVSPIGFDSDIETPQAAEQTATDYTGISIDIPLIGKEKFQWGI